MKGTSCALTGHRVLPENFDCKQLFDELEALIRGGCDTFFCGMAEGFDLMCLRLLTELRDRYSFFIEACVPCRGQENSFSAENKLLYRDLIKKCDKTTVLSERYKNGCFLVRDRYMVDCADFVFAYCTKNTGGTAYTVRYAQSAGKNVIFFNPQGTLL